MLQRGMTLLISILLVTSCMNVYAAKKSPWGAAGEIFYSSDDNITDTQWANDKAEDTTFGAHLNGHYTVNLSRKQALLFTAGLQLTSFQDFADLSNQRLTTGITYRFQTRQDFSAALYSLYLNYSVLDVDDDNRDSDLLDIGINWHRRLTTRISTVLGAEYTERQADQSDVFDLQSARYFANLDWRLGGKALLYLAYNYVDGDIVSISRARARVFNRAEAIAQDAVFSQPGLERFAYRLKAETDIYRLGLNISLARNHALDVFVQRTDSDSGGSIYYVSNVAAMSYLLRF